MNYIDTHTHIDGEEFAEDLDAVIQRAKDAGALRLFIPGISLESIKSVREVCNRYPDYCIGMIGLHPEEVKADYKEVLQTMHKELEQALLSDDTSVKPIAIGEIGLDFYWSREFEKEQLEAFEIQVQWAIDNELPLMIHCRKAQNEMVKILRKYEDKLHGGVFHCFTGNEHEAEELLAFKDFCLGIGGVLTFKKSNLPQTLCNAVPLERIVLETDAPYMAPVPHRGERNESSFIVNIIEKMAEAYSTEAETIAEVTTSNAMRVFKRYFNVLLVFVLMVLTSCGPDAYMKKGDKAQAIGEFFVAAEYYRKAYSKTPAKEHELRGARALKMAKSYERLNHTSKALGGYRNAVRYQAAKAEDILHYGRLLLKNGEYRTAENVFLGLQDSLPDNILVKNGLESAQTAAKWKQEGSNYKVKKMDQFNSRRDDYSPCLGGDDYDRLYFTSTRNEALGTELNGVTGTKSADIFYSEKDDKGKWSKPEAISSGLNTEFDEGACCITPDGKQMFLTQCTFDPSFPRYAKIMTSPRSDALWGAPTNFEISKDTLSAFAHPAVSPDGEWLYFVSDMPGGKGGLDIWRTRIGANGGMGVENLGEPINTPGNEMFPSFRPNGELYFSSDGHPGMGGLDIFVATIGDDNQYHIKNLGYPINSMGDDFGMTFEGFHNRGFFSSSRGDGRGYDKIFSFENPEVVQLIKGWVYEQEGYELLASDVRIVGSDGTNERMGVKSDGSFEFPADPGVSYIILATCNGFLNHKEELTIPEKVKESETYTLQFPLANISSPVLIDNIFFEFNKATLLETSAAALDSLVMLLNENPNITIELGAHTDYKGSEAYNKSLSQRRAEEVVKYLVKKGIAEERLTPVGYGEERPKKIRKKVAERYPWLKDGDVLTEEFITKLKPAEQETANALNRRTEFTVLRTTYNMFDEDGNIKQLPKPRKPVTTTEQSDDDTFSFDF